MQNTTGQHPQWSGADAAQAMANLRVVSQPVVSLGSIPAVQGVAGVGLPAQVPWGARPPAWPPVQWRRQARWRPNGWR